MAQQVSVLVVDDLDGSEGAETVSFGFDGRSYEIDLSEANLSQLRDALAPFVAVARKTTGGARAAATPRSRAPRAAVSDREQTAAIREWARANGHEISERGRIPNAVLQAYEARDAAAAEPVSELPAASPKKSRKRVLEPTG